MNFDLGDLLGLAFLFFFVILPAIQSFTRRGRQQDIPDEVEYNLPDKSKGETNLPRAPSDTPPPSQRPVAQQTQPSPQRPQPMHQRPQPARPPAPGQPSPAPKPRPMVSEPQKARPVQRGKTLEQLDNERLKRQPLQPQPAPRPAPVEQSTVPEVVKSHGAPKPFVTDSDAILKGMIWQQVLNEPRGRHWNKMRRSK